MDEIAEDNLSLRFRLLGLARKRVTGDLLVTFGGRWVQILLGLIGNVVSARALGPSDFGRFGLVMSAVTICGTLADAGLTYSVIRSIARYEASDTPRAHAVAWSYFLLRFGAGTLMSLLGVLLSGPIAALIGYPDLIPYLQLAFVTLFALSISSYPGAVLTGLSRFKELGIAGILNAIITVLGIVLLSTLGVLSLGTLIAWNVILPLVSTLPIWLFLPPEWLPWRLWRARTTEYQRAATSEILRFSKWMGVSLIGSILVAQGDVLLLGRLSTPAVVGVYSVALALASRLDSLNQSLFTVMMPRASRLEGAGNMRQYWRQVTGGSLALAAVLGVLALVAQPAILLLYGDKYTASAGLFLALLVVVLFDLATSSLFLLVFPLDKARMLAGADMLRVAVLGVSGWLLIPIYGAFGAVTARFLARVTGTVAVLWSLRRAIGSLGEDSEHT